MLAGTALFTVLLAVNDQNSLLELFFTALEFTILGSAAQLFLSVKVEIRDDRLTFINLLTKIDAPRDSIRSIKSDKGLYFLDKKARRHNSFAFGPSLLGDVFGYPRATRVAGLCQAWLGAPEEAPREDVTSRRRRADLFPSAFCTFAAYLILASLARLIAG